MLKFTASSVALLLSKLINPSISTGKFPKEWKLSRVVPIPKGTNGSSLGGYRPISILPVVTKIIERHVRDLILDHFSNYAPISPRQWGFMTHCSSASALIKVFDNWAQALDEGHEICVIFFDVRKAFDRVPHQLLLQQMRNLNLDPYLLRWLHDHFSNRSDSQFVAVEDEKFGKQSPSNIRGSTGQRVRTIAFCSVHQ
jgi:retron-type reverse transcriptase